MPPFTFDPAKDRANFAKHGLHLSDLAGFDQDGGQAIEDRRRDYSKVRYLAFGRIDGAGYMIAFTLREESIRLISFRRAHETEMRRYE